MKRNLTYALAACLLLPAALRAQTQQPDTTLNRTVVVEQEYAPLIRDAAKVNALPRVEEPEITPRPVEYDAAPAPATQIPADTLQAFSAQEQLRRATPGYLRVGYGNYNNLDVRANYLFLFGQRDRLNVTFAMDGMNGELETGDPAYLWDAFHYHTRAALDYTHRFDRVSLNAAGHFGLRNFAMLPGGVASRQKLTSGDVHIGVGSHDESLPVQFRAETNLLLYQRKQGYPNSDAQEVAVRTRADIWGTVAENQQVGVDLQMNNLFYRHNLYQDYTTLSLTTYYAYEANGWKLRAGVHVDPAFSFGQKFRVSPDVLVQYAFPARTTLYVQARGGRLLNDFRRLEALSPYAEPTSQLDATYEQLNAALGVRVGTLAGFGLHLYGGYQNLKDDLFFRLPGALDTFIPTFGVWNTDNFYAGAELTYSYRDIVTFTAEGCYRNWSATDEEKQAGALAFKPAFEGNFRLEIRPITPLHVQVGYLIESRTDAGGWSIDPVSNLYVGANYSFFKNFAIYARLDNLLNKNYYHSWLCPTEGINVVGGVTLRF